VAVELVAMRAGIRVVLERAGWERRRLPVVEILVTPGGSVGFERA